MVSCDHGQNIKAVKRNDVRPTTEEWIEAIIDTETIPQQSFSIEKEMGQGRPLRVIPHHVTDDESDNLRGFDPLSEDDTYDNGMRRYMENDDDEGWK